MVVENYMITKRWKEEIDLLKIEMERFLKFYSKETLPQLLDQINKIYEEIDNSMGKYTYVHLLIMADKFMQYQFILTISLQQGAVVYVW